MESRGNGRGWQLDDLRSRAGIRQLVRGHDLARASLVCQDRIALGTVGDGMARPTQTGPRTPNRPNSPNRPGEAAAGPARRRRLREGNAQRQQVRPPRWSWRPRGFRWTARYAAESDSSRPTTLMAWTMPAVMGRAHVQTPGRRRVSHARGTASRRLTTRPA